MEEEKKANKKKIPKKASPVVKKEPKKRRKRTIKKEESSNYLKISKAHGGKRGAKKENGKRFPRTGQYLYLVQIRRKHPNSHIREESKQFMKQYALGITESVRIEISKFIETNKICKE